MINNINNQIRTLNLKSLDLCNIAVSEHYTFNCKNKLRYINTKITTIKLYYRIIAHQLNITSKRVKRGLFNAIGDGLKWLLGIPDAEDAQYFNDCINE